jgi:hemoglobin-like flavoprotein
MTIRQIEQIEKTYATIQPAAAGFAMMFFRKLFAGDPSLRRLFRGDLHQHGQELIGMLGIAVGSLRDFEKLLPEVVALGQRHIAYGVNPRDYATGAAALLWTIEQALSQQSCTPEVKAAWTEMTQMVIAAMRFGAPAVAIAA